MSHQSKWELLRAIYVRYRQASRADKQRILDVKHHIPLKTERWDVTTPGFTEIDVVSHSGNSGEGEFIHSVNLTDIHTTWVERRAVMGKGRAGVRHAVEAIRQAAG